MIRRATPGSASTLRRIAVVMTAVVSSTLIANAQNVPTPMTEGAIAAHDFVAPADLDVVDAAATAVNAAAAGESLPLVVRREPTTAEAVGSEFNAAFRTTRSTFLDALEVRFGLRTVSEQVLESPRFRSFRSEFQAANPLLPVNLALSEAWAQGFDGEDVRKRLAAALQETMTTRMIGNIRPASTVFVVSLNASDRIQTWGEASRHARTVEPREIVTTETAGQDLRQSLDVLDRGAGGFMTSLLRPTVVEDLYLTGLFLRERLGEKVASRRYQRGEFIARRGETIDATRARTLAQLGRMGLEPLAAPPTPPAIVPALTEKVAVAAPAVTQRPPGNESSKPRRPTFVIVSSVGLGVLALGGVLFWSRRRRRTTTGRWLDKPAVTPRENLREAVVPHLARELKNRLVQALFAQRQELLHNEAAASDRVADLEARLAKIQPAIAEKIRGYEKRIALLESELQEKDQETRDLIRAKLVLARKELDAEITRHRAGWN